MSIIYPEKEENDMGDIYFFSMYTVAGLSVVEVMPPPELLFFLGFGKIRS